jgi:hypothetical protein
MTRVMFKLCAPRGARNRSSDKRIHSCRMVPSWRSRVPREESLQRLRKPLNFKTAATERSGLAINSLRFNLSTSRHGRADAAARLGNPSRMPRHEPLLANQCENRTEIRASVALARDFDGRVEHPSSLGKSRSACDRSQHHLERQVSVELPYLERSIMDVHLSLKIFSEDTHPKIVTQKNDHYLWG